MDEGFNLGETNTTAKTKKPRYSAMIISYGR